VTIARALITDPVVAQYAQRVIHLKGGQIGMVVHNSNGRNHPQPVERERIYESV